MSIRTLHAPTLAHTATRPRKTWFHFLRRALQAIESRRMLAGMDDRMLADIGISRAEALREASRAPWDLAPPRH